MKAVVTGAAGFIGSHLSERLLAEGVEVHGVDAFTPYYGRTAKEANLAHVAGVDGFTFTECDLRADALDRLLAGADVVVHLAAQPGVRQSWGEEFETYVGHNVLATQRVLEAALRTEVPKVVFASSSSVYGAAEALPTSETIAPLPISPYGVTKVAGESLLSAYQARGLSTVALRYFTVYGPRQRPDMAIRRFISSALTGRPVSVFGTGRQMRDFTYVDDIVRATVAAATGPAEGVFNVGGAHSISLNDLIALIETVVGRPVNLVRQPSLAGDPPSTSADITLAAQVLGYEPRTPLSDGLSSAAAWVERALHRDEQLVGGR